MNLKWMKLLTCKTATNKILFNVENLFVTMFVIFLLVKKIDIEKKKWNSFFKIN